MKIATFSNVKSLFFVSGMFAGGWIWTETHKEIKNANHLVIEDPLCSIGNKVTTITNRIVERLNTMDSPVTLVGNSLGSLICLDVARQCPENVEKVVISGSAGFGEVNLDIKLTRHNAHQVASDLVDLICYDKNKVSPEATNKTAESFQHHFRNIVGLIRESNIHQAEELIPAIQCPIYAIWGDNDVITPFEQASSVFEKYNIPTNLVGSCGHSPMYEKPKEFAQLLNQYL